MVIAWLSRCLTGVDHSYPVFDDLLVIIHCRDINLPKSSSFFVLVFVNEAYNSHTWNCTNMNSKNFMLHVARKSRFVIISACYRDMSGRQWDVIKVN